MSGSWPMNRNHEAARRHVNQVLRDNGRIDYSRRETHIAELLDELLTERDRTRSHPDDGHFPQHPFYTMDLDGDSLEIAVTKEAKAKRSYGALIVIYTTARGMSLDRQQTKTLRDYLSEVLAGPRAQNGPACG